MKKTLFLGFGALLIGVAQAQGGGFAEAPEQASSERAPDWNAWALDASRPTSPAVRAAAAVAEADIDVVDAHWMALTMWGEARREGEPGMRAVGHVIDNRRRAGMHGAYVTDTVGEAFQFSCWNPGDPNREAMLNVERVRPGSEDHRTWEEARLIAHEIMAGRSADTTGGALFYHTTAVSPRWSRGVEPVRQIGSHLFFLRTN
jgi:spore germination cell wall hydrolase CwlJ-like protein